MSNRESQIQTFLQEWKGMDQRTSPPRVQEGFFSNTIGTYFGLGENAERIPGKRIAGSAQTAVFQIAKCGNNMAVQTLQGLYIVPVTDFLNGTIPAFTVPIIDLEEDMSQAILNFTNSTNIGVSVATTATYTWTNVPLNTIVSDPDSLVTSLASNQFVLPAGTYRIKGWINLTLADRFKTRLYNVTGSSVVQMGMNALGTCTSTIVTRHTFAAPTTLEFQYNITATNADGAVPYAPYQTHTDVETGMFCEILKEP